jgi:hypothetical protein
MCARLVIQFHKRICGGYNFVAPFYDSLPFYFSLVIANFEKHTKSPLSSFRSFRETLIWWRQTLKGVFIYPPYQVHTAHTGHLIAGEYPL